MLTAIAAVVLAVGMSALPGGYAPSSAFTFMSLPAATVAARLPYYEQTVNDPAGGWGLQAYGEHVVVVTWDLGVEPIDLATHGRVRASMAIRLALAQLEAWGVTVPPPPQLQVDINPEFASYARLIAWYAHVEAQMR